MPEYSRFERRRRRIARASLYVSLVVVAGVALLMWQLIRRPAPAEGDMTWHETDWDTKPPVRWFRQYVRIDTGPAGDELAGALFVSSALREAGLSPEILTLGEHSANLRAVLPGRRSEELILLGHGDVEPTPDPESWQEPPFSGALVGPMIWGRGTFDMKSYTAAQVFALHDLAAGPAPPARSVTLVLTGGEESGSDLGMRWVLWQRPDWFEHAWAVLTEGGLVEARSLSDAKYWAVETGQRTQIFFRVCARERGRLEAFQEDVLELIPTLSLTRTRVPDAVRTFWAAYWPSRDREELRRTLADPGLLERDAVAVAKLPGYLRSLVEDQIALGPIEPSPDGGGWEAILGIALLPGTEVQPTLDRLLPDWLTAGIVVTRIEPATLGGVSPVDHPAFEATARTLSREEAVPHVGPFVLAWTMTDGRFLRPRGVPVYGVTPFLFLTPETFRAAHRNEKVPAPAFVRGVDLYRDVVASLAEPRIDPGAN